MLLTTLNTQSLFIMLQKPQQPQQQPRPDLLLSSQLQHLAAQ
jgi:hypothetical protein